MEREIYSHRASLSSEEDHQIEDRKLREQAEYDRLYKIVQEEKDKIEVDGSTDPQQLDTYLESRMTLHQWLSQHPRTSDKEPESAYHTEKYWEARKTLTGSYYTEKAFFCQEQADAFRGLAGKLTDQIVIEERKHNTDWPSADEMALQGRLRAANWLRMEASCLEMPISRPLAAVKP
jgi:hypothetical protein